MNSLNDFFHVLRIDFSGRLVSVRKPRLTIEDMRQNRNLRTVGFLDKHPEFNVKPTPAKYRVEDGSEVTISDGGTKV